MRSSIFKKHVSRLFFCEHPSSGVFGPAVGFLLAGALLNLWIDGTPPAEMTVDDKLWIGNWWIGFVIGGVCCLVVGLLITLLPAKLASAEKAQKT